LVKGKKEKEKKEREKKEKRKRREKEERRGGKRLVMKSNFIQSCGNIDSTSWYLIFLLAFTSLPSQS
jgi:hypothetical protein